MPFKAKLENSEIVCAFDYKNPKKALHEETLFCPDCGSPMHIVENMYGLFFFRHNSMSECKNSRPESIAHLRLKQYFANKLKENKFNVEIEKSFNAIGRRADVYGCSPKGQNVVYEIQTSSIAYHEVISRIRDYNSIGIECNFVFDSHNYKCSGSKAAFEMNKMFIMCVVAGPFIFEYEKVIQGDGIRTYYPTI